MGSKRVSLLLACVLLAAVATVVIHPTAAVADPSTATLHLSCVAHAPIIGDQSADQDFDITTDAPLAVNPGDAFSITATQPVGNIAGNQSGGTVSGIQNIAIKVPVPANATYVSGSLTGGFNYGGTATVTLSGSATTGTIVMSVPGPIPANQNYQLPALKLTFTATGPAFSTIQPKMGGTGTSSASVAGFTTTAVITSPISANVETDCYPTAPNPAWSTTTIVPVDTTAPTITVNTPAEGGMYPLGGSVQASYQCSDGQFGSGVATCNGTVANGSPIDTAALGTHTFTVNATDNKGNVATPVTHTYTVVPAGNDHTPPTINLSTPPNGAVYIQGAAVNAAYTCNDDGSGISSCAGDVANGAAISTATTGPHTFTVTATDGEGNHAAVLHSYLVTPAATAQHWTTGDVTDRMPVGCDTLLNAFHESIPVTTNTAPVTVGAGQQFTWNIAIGQDVIPTLNNGSNLIYRWKKPVNGHFVSAVLSGSGAGVNSPTVKINADGTMELDIASVTDTSILGFGDDSFTPPPIRAVVQADGAIGTQVQNWFDYFQLTTTTVGLVTTTQHCPAGDTYNGRTNVALTKTTILDDTPPTIAISSPGDGQTYAPNTTLPLTYSCTDDHGTPTCVGDVASGTALNTSTSGAYTVHVTSVDTAGNTATRTVSYTIADPTVAVGDATVTEGPGATLQFPVTLSNPSSRTVSVDYATSDGTALQPGDYTNTTGTLTFAPGDPLTKMVSVPVNDDSVWTGNRTMTLSLVSVFHASASTSSATGTIVDDDPPPVSVDDAAVTEGPGATLDFAVTLSAQPNVPVTVDYQTADDTAVAPGRYTATAGSLTFNPGDALTQHVLVPVTDDAIYNEGASAVPTQTMTLGVTEPANGYADTGIGTITDDETQPPLLRIGSATITEGDAFTRTARLSVTLNKPATTTVTVHYATALEFGGAAIPSDFKGKSGTLTFKPGTISKPVSVVVNGDTITEPNEKFDVKLSGATGGALIAKDTGTVTILDDDSPTASDLQATVGDLSLYEGGGTKPTQASFVVTLNHRPTSTVTMHYVLVGDSAHTGTDFKTKTGTLTFKPNNVFKVVTVAVIADLVNEPDETFKIVLSDPSSGLTITRDTGVATILNDD